MKKTLSEKIREKFGSVSAFARAIEQEEQNIYRTLRSVEDGNSKPNYKTRSHYQDLENRCDSTGSVKKKFRNELTAQDIHKVKKFFEIGTMSPSEFAEKNGISKALIYSVMKGDYMKLTKKVGQLMDAIDEAVRDSAE